MGNIGRRERRRVVPDSTRFERKLQPMGNKEIIIYFPEILIGKWHNCRIKYRESEILEDLVCGRMDRRWTRCWRRPIWLPRRLPPHRGMEARSCRRIFLFLLPSSHSPSPSSSNSSLRGSLSFSLCSAFILVFFPISFLYYSALLSLNPAVCLFDFFSYSCISLSLCE